MKAIGVKELSCVFVDKSRVADAEACAVVATRQYAKRQMTWFRNQLREEWQVIEKPAAAALDSSHPSSR
jgi:tRNA dimethylallyltransferase